ncbi:hypothetical protein MTO96_042429 [Rhipicephalus appendiculatus]
MKNIVQVRKRKRFWANTEEGSLVLWQPTAHGEQPGKHEGSQAGSEVCSPSDPRLSPQQHSNTNKGHATENTAASPNQGLSPAQQSPETPTSAPQSPSLAAELPGHSTEFSPELVGAAPKNMSRPPDVPGTGAKPLSPSIAIAEGPVATNTAAVAQDNSDSPLEKSPNEASPVKTASQHPDHSDKAKEHLAHQEDSSNEHHIVDMMHAEGSKPNECADGIEPASGAPPAPDDGAKPEENAAHAEHGDQKPAGAGHATAASPLTTSMVPS